MPGTRWSRLRNVGGAALIAVVSVGVQSAPAAAPPDGTLYGTTFPARLASIDPATGALNPVVDVAGIGPNPLVVAMASDPKAATIDALVGTCTVCPNAKGGGPVFWQVARVDVLQRSIHGGAVLQRSLVDSIAVDPATHDVWGVVDCSFSCGAETVVRVDPSTGVETDVATLPVTAFFDTLVALAPKRHTLYVVIPGADSRLFEVGTVNGSVSTGVSLGPGITGMAVDSSSGALFVLRSGLQQTVERIDPTTGAATILASLPGFGLSSATVDPRSHTLFAAQTVILGSLHEIAIVSVNDRTGAMSTGQPINAIVGPIAFLRMMGQSDG